VSTTSGDAVEDTMGLDTGTQERVPVGTGRSPRFLAALAWTTREARARRRLSHTRHRQVSAATGSAPLLRTPIVPVRETPEPPPAAPSPVVPPSILLPLLALRPVSIPSPWVPFDVEQWSRNAGRRPV
jgi:hypothetical protein